MIKSDIKYVFFGTHNDYDEIALNGVIDDKNVIYIKPGLVSKNILLKKLHRIHTSQKVNRVINLPFKSIWYSKYFTPIKLSREEQVFFIFYEMNPLSYNFIFLDHLRKKYKNCKIIYRFSNPINKHTPLTVDELKQHYDHLITFDKEDAKKYNLTEMIYGYSIYNPNQNKNKNENDFDCVCDVFFVGANKGRLLDLIDIYKKLTSFNLKCCFYISGVEEKDKYYHEGIIYNKYLSYEDVIRKVKNSKYIVELVQGGQSGVTLRTYEALTYKKKLITNNQYIKQMPFYNEDMFYYFKSISEINYEMLFNNSKVVEHNNYHNYFSPDKFLLNIRELSSGK